MDQHLMQGWHADPFGRHEQRYFSAGRPTKLVRDGRVEAYDEPPSDAGPADGVAAATSVSAPATGAAGTEVFQSDAPGVSAGQVAGASREPGPAGYPQSPHRRVRARRRRTGLINTAVALVAAGAVVAFVAIEGGFSPGHQPKSRAGSAVAGTDLTAFVTGSARSTLAQKTADVSLTATTAIGGIRVPLHGSGQVDFASNTADFHLSASYSGTTFAESEIMTSQALYVAVTVNGQNMAQSLGGKHWIEIPLASSAMHDSTPQDSPAWSLQLLEQQGARITPLGSKAIGGLSCNGYAVNPSRQAMLAAAQQEWSEQGLSSSEMAAARQLLENSTPPTIVIWLDPTRHLTCELDVAMQMGTGTSAGSGSAPATESIQMVLTFTHYGVPVDITAPPQSDTFSFPSQGVNTF